MGTISITNARILRKGRVGRANILVAGGKIAAVTDTKYPKADDRIDARGRIVLPGLVDGHAHLYDPAFTYREDFTSGTAAALAGGVTSVVEMILTTPVDSPDRVRAKIEEGVRSSLIDFSLHAGMMNSHNLSNIPAITELGVRSFKTFTCKPHYVDDHTLMSLMQQTKMNRSILNVHAEDETIANDNFKRLSDAGRKDPMAHAEWKPNLAEAAAVEKLVRIASGIDGRVHISHVSTKEGVSAVRLAKSKRVRVTAETCPHYLTFTRKDMKKHGPYLKMNPSLKGPRDVAALWKGLRDGALDMVTSEHAPGTKAEKEPGWEDIWKAWGGVPAIETMLPALLSEGVNKHRITLADLQAICCEKPAKVFGLHPKKGVLLVGADADLVIVDLKMKRKVKAERLHQKVDWTPYEGWTFKGWPVMTMRRGEIMFQDDQMFAKPGGAEFLPMSI